MFQKSAVVLFSLIAVCHGLFEELRLDQNDVLVNSGEVGRTFNFTSITGGASIDGLSILKVALILLLFKILYALALGRNVFSGFGDRTYESVYQNRRDSYYYDDEAADDQFSSRKLDHLQEDFAAKMHQLEKAFKKYSVHDIECQMYVSCESALTHRHEENGPLARIANDIISSMVDRRNFSEAKLSPEMDGITQAFTYGRDAESFGTEDACAPLRSKCVELQNKKHKNY